MFTIVPGSPSAFSTTDGFVLSSDPSFGATILVSTSFDSSFPCSFLSRSVCSFLSRVVRSCVFLIRSAFFLMSSSSSSPPAPS